MLLNAPVRVEDIKDILDIDAKSESVSRLTYLELEVMEILEIHSV